MVNSLVDTSIIIDLVRGFPEAHQWLQTITDEVGVTQYVWLEVIQGAQNKAKQQAAVKLLISHRFQLQPPMLPGQ